MATLELASGLDGLPIDDIFGGDFSAFDEASTSMLANSYLKLGSQWHDAAAVPDVLAGFGDATFDERIVCDSSRLHMPKAEVLPKVPCQPAGQWSYVQNTAKAQRIDGDQSPLATSATLASATSTLIQRMSTSDVHKLSNVEHCSLSPSVAQDDVDDISKAPAGCDSSGHRQRSKERLDKMLQQLAALVPACDNRYVCAREGMKRPRHVVLADAIHTIRLLQDQLRSHSGIARQPGAAAGSTAATVQSAAYSAPLDMPLPVDIDAASTGVLVDAKPGAGVWRLRVTCRDRPGLLGDVAVALRNLPLGIVAASIQTTPSGKAQQVFEVSVLDECLAPEEVQCAVNAALYAHLVPKAATRTSTPVFQPTLAAHTTQAKRSRLV